MLILGLTGSIGMGKSAAAAHLRAKGLPVFDADAAVHALYAGSAVPLIEAAFPGTTALGRVDRVALTRALGGEAAAFARLEAIVHPLVREAERAFLAAEFAAGTAVSVLEIPLLFETGADRLVDATLVVSARPELQRERVMSRPGMTDDKFAQLLARQMPDAEKRGRADFVVDTSGSFADTRAQIDQVLATLVGRVGVAFARHWSA